MQTDRTRLLPDLATHGPAVNPPPARHVTIQAASDLQRLARSQAHLRPQHNERAMNSGVRKPASAATEADRPRSEGRTSASNADRKLRPTIPSHKSLPPVPGAVWDVGGAGTTTGQRVTTASAKLRSRRPSFGQGERLRGLLDRNAITRDLTMPWRIEGALSNVDGDDDNDSFITTTKMVVKGANDRSKAPAFDSGAADEGLQQGKLCEARVDPPQLAAPLRGAPRSAASHGSSSYGSNAGSLRHRRPSNQYDPQRPASRLQTTPQQQRLHRMQNLPIQQEVDLSTSKSSDAVTAPVRTRVRLRWKMAIKAVHNLLRATCVFRIAPAATPAWQHPERGADAKKGDSVLKSKVHLLLSKTRPLRTLADFAALDPHLTRLSPFLESLTAGQRKAFYLGTLTYESHAAGTMLLRDGGTAESVYFILGGTLEVYREHKGFKVKQGVIGPGGVVGHISAEDVLKRTDVKRSANVVCLETCEMLRVDVDEYTRTVFGHDGSNTETLVSLLNSLPHFQSTLETVLLKAAQSCALCTYAPGEQILSENDAADRVFFLCKGEATASRHVPFLNTYSEANISAGGPATPQVLPYDDTYPPRPGEEVVFKDIKFGPVTSGESFPAMYLPDGMEVDQKRSKRAEFWPKDREATADSESTTIKEESAPPAKSAPLCNVTVVATSEVQCAVIGVDAFLRLATNQMVEMVMAGGEKYKAKMIELQETYLYDTDPKYRQLRLKTASFLDRNH
ncbi:hypothetical protein HDU86_007261 [Geranomyces michiganensis]|nr:hypothetical protein HDU86_007261 [Geranomyces michiganensis]